MAGPLFFTYAEFAVCSEPFAQDVLCVNGNPALRVIAPSCVHTTQELSPKLPEDHAVVDPAFIDRVYTLASQI